MLLLDTRALTSALLKVMPGSASVLKDLCGLAWLAIDGWYGKWENLVGFRLADTDSREAQQRSRYHA